MKVLNPILKGFNPDPSLLRVGEDYYIATSTFEWFPGVCIHHSKDLVNWEIVSYALTNEEDVDMTGIDGACGIWAPNLTYNNGKFYLAYTIVYTNRARHKDTHNFIVTAPSVKGPWSKPVQVSKSGFDPSVFHDDDGKKYLVNMTLDYRPDMVRFSGIDVQEWDEETGRLLGEPVRVFRGTPRGMTEGPNIFKKDGWYYLVCAEGGTQVDHCATVVRSRSVWGPYEESDKSLLLTSVGEVECNLKRAGHSQIIEGADGNWYMAHLCSRPLQNCSILGRETGIQNVEWTEDGWVKLSDNDDAAPADYYEVPGVDHQKPVTGSYTDFSKVTEMPLEFMTLRKSFASNGVKLEDGVLRIEGGNSLFSKYFQGLVARRQQSFDCDLVTAMRFEPRHMNHLAGIQAYYNYDNFFNLRVTRDEKGKYVDQYVNDNGAVSSFERHYLPEEMDLIYLKMEIRHEEIRMYYSLDNENFTQVGEAGDMKHISDEHIEGNGFTGSMLGVSCQDIQGDGVHADFLFIDYKEFS